VLLLGVPSKLSSSSLVGRHVGAAPCPSSSLLELRVPVAGSPHRRIRGQHLLRWCRCRPRGCCAPFVSLPLRLHRLRRYEVNHLLCERVVCGACFPDNGGSGGVLPVIEYDGGGSFSPQIRYSLVADVHSTFKLHHGGGSGCRILRLHQVLTPAVEFDGGSGSTSSAIRRFRAAAATGRTWNLEGAMCIFQVSQGFLCKIVRVVLCLY
jgi:hypothetical protein